MDKEYSIRPYAPGDEDNIVPFLQLVFGGWPHFDLDCSALEHWLWKNRDNPAGKGNIFVGESQGRIVCCIFSQIMKIKFGDRILRGVFGIDGAVHPAFRSKGLFAEILETRKEKDRLLGGEILVALSANPRVISHQKRMGAIEFPHPLTNYYLIRDVDLHLRKMKSEHAWMKRYFYKSMKKAYTLRKLLKTPSDSIIDINPVQSFDDGIDNFWRKTSNHYNLIMERSREYLNWRYCDRRAGKFTVKVAVDGDVLGYSVLRVNNWDKDYPNGVIEDLIALPDRPDISDALLKDAIEHFGDNVNVIRCMVVDGHSITKILQSYGFVNIRFRPFFYYEPYVDLGYLKNTNIKPSAMHFMGGDFDWG